MNSSSWGTVLKWARSTCASKSARLAFVPFAKSAGTCSKKKFTVDFLQAPSVQDAADVSVVVPTWPLEKPMTSAGRSPHDNARRCAADAFAAGAAAVDALFEAGAPGGAGGLRFRRMGTQMRGCSAAVGAGAAWRQSSK